jgi:carbon-monoxide dehydrogenase medium subunit
MKPPSFSYVAPRSVAATVSSLAEHGDEAKILAGGQSLVPALSFRLARPEVLVDINRLQDLPGLAVEDSRLRVGALVRHEELLSLADRGVTDPLGALMGLVGRQVGHLPIRLRGTLVGSIAHADPAAEWCALAVAMDAQARVVSDRGERTVAAAELFDAPFMTSLEPDELITEVAFPLLGAGSGVGFAELARTAGDFAVVAAVAALQFDGPAGETVTSARIGLAGVAGHPVRARDAEAVLAGQPPTAEALDAAAAAAAGAVDPVGDLHASADYRKHLVRVLTRRALTQASTPSPQTSDRPQTSDPRPQTARGAAA